MVPSDTVIVHCVCVGLALSLAVAFSLLGGVVTARRGDIGRRARLVFGSVLMVNELVTQMNRLYTGKWSMATCLPLQFCDYGLWAAVYFLLTSQQSKTRKFLCEFVALIASPLAFHGLLTPSVQTWFPSCEYLNYVLCHGITFISPYIAYGTDTSLQPYFSPSFQQALFTTLKHIAFGNALVVVSSLFNLVIPGANYMFTCHKPFQSSLFDLLGPWPWYMLVIELLLIPHTFLVYYAFVSLGLVRHQLFSHPKRV
ncbi:Integral membrane protein [Pelomyxa schiedti]|nr:Integral membrane protein [Pelomyxa schiedti]